MRRWIKVGAWLFLAIGSLAYLWVSADLKARDGDRFFRADFGPTPRRFSQHDYDWAAAFGGHAGLGRLQTLSSDQAINGEGRKIARDVYLYIHDGAYQRELGRWADETPLFASPKAALHWRYRYLREIFLSLIY